jgi:hypothetical protein
MQQNLVFKKKSFNPQMKHLVTNFLNVIHEDLNIYAFGKGLPLNENWVRFSFRHIKSYLTWFIS